MGREIRDKFKPGVDEEGVYLHVPKSVKLFEYKRKLTNPPDFKSIPFGI